MSADDNISIPQLDEAKPPYQYGEVRRCKCHGLYWRPYSYSPSSRRVYAHGHVGRDTWSGDDIVNTFTFEEAEWEALERA